MSVDKWLLQALSGPEAVGLFTAAALVTQMPILALSGWHRAFGLFIGRTNAGA